MGPLLGVFLIAALFFVLVNAGDIWRGIRGKGWGGGNASDEDDPTSFDGM